MLPSHYSKESEALPWVGCRPSSPFSLDPSIHLPGPWLSESSAWNTELVLPLFCFLVVQVSMVLSNFGMCLASAPPISQLCFSHTQLFVDRALNGACLLSDLTLCFPFMAPFSWAKCLRSQWPKQQYLFYIHFRTYHSIFSLFSMYFSISLN